MTELSDDARAYLMWGCGDRVNGRNLPDGRRHHDAVQDLLNAGLVHYAPLPMVPLGQAQTYLQPTPEGKALAAQMAEAALPDLEDDCTCGHTYGYHSEGREGPCLHPDCGCRAFKLPEAS